jgi:putative methyltransferase (TIGR04325 family)
MVWDGAFLRINMNKSEEQVCGRGKRRMWSQGRAIMLAMLPAALRRKLRIYSGWKWFRGDYASWSEAREASGGYEDAEVLRHVMEATLVVQSGQAEFERDSVLFYEQNPDVPLITVLQNFCSTFDGSFRVLDFGGSLGSVYWRHRQFLPVGETVRWDVVEQPAFVEAGRRHVTEPALHFYETVEGAEAQSRHDLLLCSCVLQYLEEPFRFLEEWSRLDVPYVLLNNLPLRKRGRDRIKIQHVPPSIYAASYPVWFFNRAAFLRRVSAHYEIVKEFDSEAVWPVGFGMFQSTGLLLKRRVST